MSAVWVDVAPSAVVIADRRRLGFPGFRRPGRFRGSLNGDLVSVATTRDMRADG